MLQNNMSKILKLDTVTLGINIIAMSPIVRPLTFIGEIEEDVPSIFLSNSTTWLHVVGIPQYIEF